MEESDLESLLKEQKRKASISFIFWMIALLITSIGILVGIVYLFDFIGVSLAGAIVK